MKKVVVKTKKLQKILNYVKYAVNKDDSHNNIANGIYVEVKNNWLDMATCNGFMLLSDYCEVEGDDFKCVIPVFKIPKKSNELTIIEVHKDIVVIDFGIEKIEIEKIKNKNFNWKSILKMPKNFVEISVNSKYLKKALKGETGEVNLKIALGTRCSPLYINCQSMVLPIVRGGLY